MLLRRLLAPVAVVALLAGCSGPAPTPEPQPSEPSATIAAEPTTLAELAKAVADEGLVDTAGLTQVMGDPGAVNILLGWDDLPTAEEQIAALAEVDSRVDDLPIDRPEVTNVTLTSVRDDGTDVMVTTAGNPGDEALLSILDVVTTSLCSTASLETRNPGDEAGERSILDLRCFADATGIVGLAEAYDEATAQSADVDGIDETRWEVWLKDQPTSNANLRLDVGPIDGRQQLLTEVATLADDEGADQMTIIDTGNALTVVGFADAAQKDLCQTMFDRILEAGVERASVSLQLRDTTPEDWACRVTP